jgi:hypothetical protein
MSNVPSFALRSWGTSALQADGAALYGLLAVALGMRFAYYLVDPTLSSDEAQLALNLMSHSYGGLFGTLDFNQAAPLGFLYVQKVVIGVFGSSDHALRLFPLVGAIAAALLFHPVMSRFVGKRAAYLALVLFAFSGLLLTYAATSKQYSTDVATTLALYGVVLRTGDDPDRSRTVVLAIVGAVAVWLSHPAIFVEAGIGSVLVAESLVARRPRRTASFLIVCGVWLVSFGTFYLLTRSNYAHLQHSIAKSTAVIGAHGGPGQARTYGGTVRALFGVPHVGFVLRNGLTAVGVALCAVGFAAMLVRRRTKALLLAAPALFVVVASAIGLYPIFPRTLLFFVPALLAFTAYGAEFGIGSARARPVKAAAAAIVGALVVVVAVPSANHLRIKDGAEFKQAMRYVANNEHRGDSLYVYSAAQYDVRYYLECNCLGDRSTARRARALWPLRPTPGGAEQSSPAMRSVVPQLVVGRSTSDVPSRYREDFTPLLGRARVWILFTAGDPPSSAALISYLDAVGVRKEMYRVRGDAAMAAFYDLSR